MDTSTPIAAYAEDPMAECLSYPKRTWSQWIGYYYSSICYFIGGWCFLIGSILYYPGFANIYDIVGEGSLIGAWLFVVGCVFFVFASSWEIFTTRLCQGPKLLPYLPLICSVVNVMGSVQFVAGAVYFVPIAYATGPSVGCYLFITGCSTFLIANLIDFARFIQTGSFLRQIWWHLTTFFNLLGNIWFIVGSYYFLPEFLAPLNDPTGEIATSNTIFAVNFYVIGSVGFVLGPTFYVLALYKDSNRHNAESYKPDI